MQKYRQFFWNRMLLAFLCSGLMITTAQAGTPLWTFAPLTATNIVVLANGTATVQYRVTNQSSRPHTLEMQPIQGITQNVTGSGICGNPFVLPGKGSCILSLQIDGSQLTSPIEDGPIVCQQGSTLQCYRPSAANILRITQAITLLSIDPNSGPASGGTGVILTGTGFTGVTSVTFDGIAATSVNVVNSTMVTAVTPAHAVGLVDVSIYKAGGQSTLANGFRYDTTAVGQPSGGGIIACLGGAPFLNLIAAIADNSAGMVWGPLTTITGAQSNIDGAANTATIVAVLGTTSNYAARVCSDFEVDSQGNTPCQAGNTCYNDWFLPAGNNPAGQLQCLYDNSVTGGVLVGFAATDYWSSTESSPPLSAGNAWDQLFTLADGESEADKDDVLRVRCVRAFTP